MNTQAVITFPNTHSAMLAKRALGGVLDFMIMPTPRSITKSCGIALRLTVEDIETARAQFALAGLSADDYVVHRGWAQDAENEQNGQNGQNGQDAPNRTPDEGDKSFIAM